MHFMEPSHPLFDYLVLFQAKSFGKALLLALSAGALAVKIDMFRHKS